MIYFTIFKGDGGFMIDSISENYSDLKSAYPNKIIYKSDKKILSTYVTKDKLNET